MGKKKSINKDIPKEKKTHKVWKLDKEKYFEHKWRLDTNVSWENYDNNIISSEEIAENWVIADISKWNYVKIFTLIDLQSKERVQAQLHSKLPRNLSQQICIWDRINYILNNWNYYITKREIRDNIISRIKWDNTRFSQFSKYEQVIACNIDYWIIVCSSKNPDFQSNFLDRYIILFQNWNVKPLIVITKSDLGKPSNEILDWYSKSLWIRRLYCSNETWEWINKLKEIIYWKIVVFVWNSWAWKSTLINSIHNKDITKTQWTSKKRWEWKHTTTKSQMYEWMENSYIIDTPWIRSLELMEIDKKLLKEYFIEFKEFETNCKYNDCNHILEDDCWVKNAVEKWIISNDRYNNYVKIYNKI